MATPINLGKVRKSRAKADKRQRAAENRVKFGRTKTEKARDVLNTSRASKSVDHANLEDE